MGDKAYYANDDVLTENMMEHTLDLWMMINEAVWIEQDTIKTFIMINSWWAGIVVVMDQANVDGPR